MKLSKGIVTTFCKVYGVKKQQAREAIIDIATDNDNAEFKDNVLVKVPFGDYKINK